MARILVIDDEKLARMALNRMLKAGGHEVVEAENGRQGLCVYEESPVDLVVTDILMPEMEGLETIRELQRRWPEVKIISITGGGLANGRNTLRAAKEFGAHAVLAKPFREQEFLKLVEEALQAM